MTEAAAVISLVALAGWYQNLADAYDAEQWRLDAQDHCRYGASAKVMLTWWWQKKFGSVAPSETPQGVV